MRKTLIATAILAAASLTLSLAPASAQAGRFDPGLQSSTQAQGYTGVRFHRGGYGRGGFHNRGHRGFRHGGYGRHRGRYGHGYRRGGFNAGAGIAGLAAGAIIGGAIASQTAPAYASPGGNAVAYCSQKFKSYDPSRGTYLGYDGDRHACP